MSTQTIASGSARAAGRAATGTTSARSPLTTRTSMGLPPRQPHDSTVRAPESGRGAVGARRASLGDTRAVRSGCGTWQAVDRLAAGASGTAWQHDRPGGGCHRGGVRRHRDVPAVRDEGVPGRRWADPGCRHRPGGRLAGVLGADPGGHDQVPDLHHARGQPRRGRGAGPARAAAGRPAQDGQGQGHASRGADPDRRGAAVRRRGADPGDLGAQRRGGHRGAQPATGVAGRAGDLRDPAGPVPGPVPGHPAAGPGVRAGDDRLVHPDRRPGPGRGPQGADGDPGAVTHLRVPDADRQRDPRVPAARLDHPGGDRGRGAVRRHGPLRVPARSGWPGCRWSSPRWSWPTSDRRRS